MQLVVTEPAFFLLLPSVTGIREKLITYMKTNSNGSYNRALRHSYYYNIFQLLFSLEIGHNCALAESILSKYDRDIIFQQNRIISWVPQCLIVMRWYFSWQCLVCIWKLLSILEFILYFQLQSFDIRFGFECQFGFP